MPTPKLLPGLTLLLLILVLVPGCGGGESDEDRISEAIETSATSDDPADCTELQTQAFVEQTEFAQGRAAVEACEEVDETAIADSVEVAEIEVDGDAATAEATFEGSSFDGQTLVIDLVKDGDAWKLDRITAFRDFDKEAFLDAFGESLTAPPDPIGAEEAECIVRFLGKSEEKKLQDVLLGGDPAPLQSLFALCA